MKMLSEAYLTSRLEEKRMNELPAWWTEGEFHGLGMATVLGDTDEKARERKPLRGIFWYLSKRKEVRT